MQSALDPPQPSPDLSSSGGQSADSQPSAPTMSFEAAHALGMVWALTGLWKPLRSPALRRVLRRTRCAAAAGTVVVVFFKKRPCKSKRLCS